MRASNRRAAAVIPVFGYAAAMERCFWSWLAVAICLAACGGGARSAETQSVTGEACDAGRQKYTQRRDALMSELSAKGCQADADCGALWESNACVNNCGSSAPVAGIESATAELDELARQQCGSCPPIPVPPCVPRGAPKCEQGRCIEGP